MNGLKKICENDKIYRVLANLESSRKCSFLSQFKIEKINTLRMILISVQGSFFRVCLLTPVLKKVTSRRLIFAKINYHMNLLSRMQVLPYFTWIYFQGR